MPRVGFSPPGSKVWALAALETLIATVFKHLWAPSSCSWMTNARRREACRETHASALMLSRKLAAGAGHAGGSWSCGNLWAEENVVSKVALIGFRGGGQQGGQESSEQGFAPASGVVHEFEEGKIVGQFLLRDAAVRPQPGAQQRPNTFHGAPARHAFQAAPTPRAPFFATAAGWPLWPAVT